MKILFCLVSLFVAQHHQRYVVQGLAVPASVADESSNNLARWKDRWDTNVIGWHKDQVNDFIQAHGDKLLQPPDDDESCSTDNNGGMRVLVPLCGKSVDVAFFAKQSSVAQVVGVDGIMKALETFSAEHPDLEIKETDSIGSFRALKAKNITLLKGDFFDLDDSATGGKFSGVYDRAAMVAIQPHLREKYVAILQRLIAPGGRILLATVEHDTGSGPPFSVWQLDLQTLYGSQDWVKSITQLNPEETETDDKGRVTRWYLIQAM